jgi:hypothetical protein
MATTVNGYPVIPAGKMHGPGPHLRKWYVPAGRGLKHHERHFILREGAMGFVLMHFILWFHETVERLDINRVWDEWGHAVRPVRGQSTGYSTHAGGGAADLNATRHPRGRSARRTFSGAKIKLIRLRIKMKMYRGVLNWGGDWRTPDGMHVEIARVPMKRVISVARALAKTPRGRRILKANPGARDALGL